MRLHARLFVQMDFLVWVCIYVPYIGFLSNTEHKNRFQ